MNHELDRTLREGSEEIDKDQRISFVQESIRTLRGILKPRFRDLHEKYLHAVVSRYEVLIYKFGGDNEEHFELKLDVVGEAVVDAHFQHVEVLDSYDEDGEAIVKSNNFYAKGRILRFTDELQKLADRTRHL